MSCKISSLQSICSDTEVCKSQCSDTEVCCKLRDSSTEEPKNNFNLLIDDLIKKANVQVEVAKSRLETLVDLNPIRFGSNTISFKHGVTTHNTKTYFSVGGININCLEDKLTITKNNITSQMPMCNPHIIYADELHVVVLSEIDEECCIASVISTNLLEIVKYNVDVVEYYVDNPKTSPVVHMFDGMIRSMTYDVNVLAVAAPRFIDMSFKTTPTCVSGSLICDSQYSYIAGHDHVYSRFYNPFTGKCLMFDQSGVTHEYGSIFTKDGVHVEVDSRYLY